MRIPALVETVGNDLDSTSGVMSEFELFVRCKEASFTKGEEKRQPMAGGTILIAGTVEEDRVKDLEAVPGVVAVWCSKTIELFW